LNYLSCLALDSTNDETKRLSSASGGSDGVTRALKKNVGLFSGTTLIVGTMIGNLNIAKLPLQIR